MALKRLRKVQLPQHESLGRPKRDLEILIGELEKDSLSDEKFFNDLHEVIGQYKKARMKHTSDLHTEDANEAMTDLCEILEAVR